MNGETPTAYELSVAEEIYKLEQSSPEFKADLEKLFILGAKDVESPTGKKSLVLMVPYKLLDSFRKIQVRFVRELEKKLQVRDFFDLALLASY